MYNSNKLPQNSLNNNPHINYPTDHIIYPQCNWVLPPGNFNPNPIMAINSYVFSNNFQPSHHSYSPSAHFQFIDNYNTAYSANHIPPHFGLSRVRPVNVHNSQNRSHINYQNDINSRRQNTNPLQQIYKALIQKQKQKPSNFMHQTNSLEISSSQKNKNGLEKNQSSSCIPMYELTTKQNEFYSTSSMNTKQIIENMEKINQNNKMIKISQSRREIGNVKSSGKITESHYKSIQAKQTQEQQNHIFDKVSKLQKDRSSRINKSSPSNSKRKNSGSNKQKIQQKSLQQQQNIFMKKTNHIKVPQKQQQYRIRKTQSESQYSYESINIQGTVVQKIQQKFNNPEKNMKTKMMPNYSLAQNIGRRQMGIQTNIQPETTKLYHSIYKFSQLLKRSQAYSKGQSSILAQKSKSPLEQRIQQFFEQHPEILEPPQIIIRMEQSVMNSIKSSQKKRKNNYNINISEKVKKKNNNKQSNLAFSRLPDVKFFNSISTIKDEQQQQKKVEASAEIQESYDQSEVMQSFQEQKLCYKFLQRQFQKQNNNQNETKKENYIPTMTKKNMNQSIKYTVNILDDSKYKQSQHITNKESQIKTQQRNQPNLGSFVKQLYENLKISTSSKFFNMKTSFLELKQIVMLQLTQLKKYISAWMQEIIDTYKKALFQKEQTIFTMYIEKMDLENQLRQIKRKMQNILKDGNQYSLNSIKRLSDQQINSYIINKNSSCNKFNLLENTQLVTDQLKVKQSKTWKELNRLQQIISSQIYKIQSSKDNQKPIKEIQIKMPCKISQQSL